MTTMTTTRPASARQTFALFCATGKDWRSANLTADQASAMIGAAAPHRGNKPAALAVVTAILNGEDLPTAPAVESPASLWKRAKAAGDAAAGEVKTIAVALACDITGKPAGIHPDFPCGFAWVRIPRRGKLHAYLKANGIGRKSSVGWVISAGQGQSYRRNTAAAHAIAKVLIDADIEATVESRED
jgi:hypothetical protein